MAAAESLLKSAYEVARENRLKRNRQVMLELGLVGTEQQQVSHQESKSHVKKQKKREPLEPQRRSKRVQGLNPEGEKMEQKEKEEEGEEEEEEDDFSVRMQVKIARLIALHEERDTSYKNPTATYEHTWMRVRTMSDKALERRVKVIENALGQHCVVKMRMFAEVLLLADKEELAQNAAEALDRLLALGLK